jgi:hypothetical protein
MGECLNPDSETLAELNEIESSEDATDGVMGGDAVIETEKGLEEVNLLETILFDLDHGIAAADGGTED